MTYEVGQKVIIRSLYSRDSYEREGVVTKVARKYATVASGPYSREELYDKETGYEKPPNGYSARVRIFTPEEIEELAERAELVDRLRELGLQQTTYGDRISTSKLRAIVAILEGE